MLTYAGLLMLGQNEVVRKYVNNFWMDYIGIPGNSYSDAAPFSPRSDGFAPEDESQLYALRKGLVNMCSHADYFSPMHPTIRVFDNRISFQNPGKIVVDMVHLRDRYGE